MSVHLPMQCTDRPGAPPLLFLAGITPTAVSGSRCPPKLGDEGVRPAPYSQWVGETDGDVQGSSGALRRERSEADRAWGRGPARKTQTWSPGTEPGSERGREGARGQGRPGHTRTRGRSWCPCRRTQAGSLTCLHASDVPREPLLPPNTGTCKRSSAPPLFELRTNKQIKHALPLTVDVQIRRKFTGTSLKIESCSC